MQYHHAVAISHVASSRGMVHLCAASASSVRMRQPLLVVYFCMRKHMSATVYKCSTPQRTRHQARVDASVESSTVQAAEATTCSVGTSRQLTEFECRCRGTCRIQVRLLPALRGIHDLLDRGCLFSQRPSGARKAASFLWPRLSTRPHLRRDSPTSPPGLTAPAPPPAFALVG